jgi:hypothetical protein
MMDLNNHIVKNNDNKPFHSSGFAQIAVGNRVGSVGTTSFDRRQQIDRERRLVYGYNRSAIGSAYGVARATKQFIKSPNTTSVNQLLPQNKVRPSGQQHFAEPPARTYNPFA